jgi:hypothetical protein
MAGFLGRRVAAYKASGYAAAVNLPGHLAVAYLVARRRPAARLSRLVPVTAGALLPDAVDKPAMFLGLTPYGRTVGHSLTFWSLALLFWAVAAARRMRAAPALALVVAGGWSHLFVDLVDDLVEGFQSAGYAFSAWAGWPYTNPDMWSWVVPHLSARRGEATTVLELLTVALCLGWAMRERDVPARVPGRLAGTRCRSKSAT